MTAKGATRFYLAANLEAARLIASDPLRYPGLMQTWARLIEAKQVPTIKGPLFEATGRAA
jgi:hypothetical protein